jgi:DNA-binding transcriptional ArsR family regulator
MALEVEDGIGRAERLHRSAEILETASRALAGLVPTLQRLANAEALRELALDHRAEITGAAVRALVAARRLRDEFLGPGLDEPCWAVLLEMLIARLEGRALSLTELAAAADVPQTTAHRRIEWLAERGLIARRPDPQDGRIILIDLTEEAADRVRAYLIAALKLSPWVA